MSTIIKADINQAKWLVIEYFKANLVPMLVGSPGCGKSDMIKQVAEEFNLKLIDVRLSQNDPTDINGFPTITERKRAGYIPFDTFPLEGDPIPEGYSGWLLFFDEFNSAPTSVQAACYKLILDRMIGQNKLHKNLAIACAGNLETDNAIVNELSTAMQSRLAHIELVFSSKIFLNWAQNNNFHTRIITYLNFKPGQANTFSPDHTDRTFACPRTWEFANRLVHQIDINHPNILLALSGVVSQPVARDFMAYCEVENTLPKMADVIANPTTAKVPHEPGSLWAMTGAVADNSNSTTIDPLITYMRRFPKEFQIVCAKQIARQNKAMTKEKAFEKWLTDTAIENF